MFTRSTCQETYKSQLSRGSSATAEIYMSLDIQIILHSLFRKQVIAFTGGAGRDSLQNGGEK